MKNFLKKFNKLFLFKNKGVHSIWNSLLIIYVILILIIISIGVYFLFKIRGEEIFQVIPIKEKKSVLINENSLKEVLDIFNKKELNLVEIKNNLNSYEDPSF